MDFLPSRYHGDWKTPFLQLNRKTFPLFRTQQINLPGYSKTNTKGSSYQSQRYPNLKIRFLPRLIIVINKHAAPPKNRRDRLPIQAGFPFMIQIIVKICVAATTKSKA